MFPWTACAWQHYHYHDAMTSTITAAVVVVVVVVVVVLIITIIISMIIYEFMIIVLDYKCRKRHIYCRWPPTTLRYYTCIRLSKSCIAPAIPCRTAQSKGVCPCWSSLWQRWNKMPHQDSQKVWNKCDILVFISYYCWWFRNPKQPPFGCIKPCK